MPKLWTETIETHRKEVREAVLDTTSALVAEHGLLSVTMSQIAEQTGIGRATLYKYFPDVEAILLAWHERQIAEHLRQLEQARDLSDDAGDALRAVLEAYAMILHEAHGHHGSEIGAMLHRGSHLDHAERRVRSLVTALISRAREARLVRSDVEPSELATYSIHAVSAAAQLPSKSAVRRLVAVTLAGLRPE